MYVSETFDVTGTVEFFWELNRNVRACLVARMRPNLAHGMQNFGVWMPVQPLGSGCAHAKAASRPGWGLRRNEIEVRFLRARLARAQLACMGVRFLQSSSQKAASCVHPYSCAFWPGSARLPIQTNKLIACYEPSAGETGWVGTSLAEFQREPITPLQYLYVPHGWMRLKVN